MSGPQRHGQPVRVSRGADKLDADGNISGYIPHNGVATIQQFIDGTSAVFGMGTDLGGFLAVYGAVFDGNLASWSIGGPTPNVASIPLLSGTPQGISGSHNKYEADASPVRGDLVSYAYFARDAARQNWRLTTIVVRIRQRLPRPHRPVQAALRVPGGRQQRRVKLQPRHSAEVQVRQVRLQRPAQLLLLQCPIRKSSRFISSNTN